MATPLVAQKTAANAGVIVNADQPADKRARVGATFVGTPCRVVVLRNMVGPGEVDADLEEEVGMQHVTHYVTCYKLVIDNTWQMCCCCCAAWIGRGGAQQWGVQQLWLLLCVHASCVIVLRNMAAG
jgi:hypothetical protein